MRRRREKAFLPPCHEVLQGAGGILELELQRGLTRQGVLHPGGRLPELQPKIVDPRLLGIGLRRGEGQVPSLQMVGL